MSGAEFSSQRFFRAERKGWVPVVRTARLQGQTPAATLAPWDHSRQRCSGARSPHFLGRSRAAPASSQDLRGVTRALGGPLHRGPPAQRLGHTASEGQSRNLGPRQWEPEPTNISFTGCIPRPARASLSQLWNRDGHAHPAGRGGISGPMCIKPWGHGWRVARPPACWSGWLCWPSPGGTTLGHLVMTGGIQGPWVRKVFGSAEDP